MSIEIGVWLAAVGCLAALVGLSSMRRLRRLRSRGVAVWAMAVPFPAPASAEERGNRTLLQYALEDGRVVEQMWPGGVRSGARLEPGDRVLIWYDPIDPQDVLVFGREGRRSDWAYVTAGSLLVVGGILVAALGP